MKKFGKKLITLGLTAAMVLSMAGCSKSENKETANSDAATATPTTAAAATATPAASDTSKKSGRCEYDSEGRRIIKVGTWYDHYYTSDHTDITDNPDLTDPEEAQMQLDNMRAIEEKYNIKLQFVNLTWEGIMESINTSIMSGIPDVDIYECDLQFGVPAALNGYAQDIASYAGADSDIMTDQVVMTYLNLMGDEKNYLMKAVTKNNQLAGYPLAFNMDMIKEANLENPQDLYDRGEWTWDKFEEYCKVLTKDVDNDGITDVYGYGGWWTTMLSALCLSNGTTIAGSTTEGLSNPATIECMDLIYRMYNTDKSACPWNQDDWNINNSDYANRKFCFFIGATWIFAEEGLSSDVGFEIGVVPWPVGPSGNKDTNYQVLTSGNYYFIPTGVEDPELVYNVFYDWNNWYNFDLELRDKVQWAKDMMMTERNFNYLEMMGTKEGFDIWGSLGLGDSFSMVPIMTGEKTAAQYAEETKNIIQDALDQYFK